ncbi:MAG: HNH endonuclease [Nitrosomonas sp.]|nr:HNH endonuclease [Nitrosomonas sp.]
MTVVVILYFLGLRVFHAMMQKYSWSFWYYEIYLKSTHWKLKRWQKKLQHRFTHLGRIGCEKCGNPKRLTIHHVNYKNLWHEPLSDLQIICWNCHRKGSGRI